tara:strand:- start:637 stop:984 length:348 start_codon:yes stop_codon:yes gene_type:complete
MAITVSWKINKLQSYDSDGFVFKVLYSIIGYSDGEEVTMQQDAIVFPKPDSLPSDFKNYDDLDEATVLSWVKASLNVPWSSDGKTLAEYYEQCVTNAVNEKLSPTTTTGLPVGWS